ncbi:MAG: 4-diphosphocytidyl-2C-methyl-D-erythritol synthase [Solirubrobacterales bacterium]|nr:4-diphosphocytidyl-2C-methyl-D-erythritol synthase [Solirubrobacterales bacterium]
MGGRQKAAEEGALGVVLAGGRGSRLGGAKPTAELAGRPLISYPLAALAEAGLEAVVVAKPDTDLPPLDVDVLAEAAEPVHPLTGIVAALRQTGRPIVVIGCDFPFVPAALLRALADAPEPLVIPAPGGEAQPLVARWTPALLPALDAALDLEEPLRRTVAALSPRLLEDAELAPSGDPARIFFNVNTPADLRRAEGAVSSLDGD